MSFLPQPLILRPLIMSVIALLVILSGSQRSLAQSNSDSGAFAPAEVTTWPTNIYYVPVPALTGSTVEIWNRTGFGYILKPYVAIDWNKFGDDIEKACEDTNQAIVSVDVQFDSDSVRQQAVRVAKQNLSTELTNLSAINLRAFPFASLRVVTGAQEEDGLETRERLRLPNVAELGLSNYTTGLNTSVLGTKAVLIDDSCDALRTIHSRKSLQAHAFITYDTSKVSSAYISLNQVSKMSAFTDLLYDEKETGEKKLLRSSSSGGWGINVGGFSVGNSSSSSSTQPIDTRERFVTERTLSHAIGKAASQISVTTLATDGNKAMSHNEVLVLVNQFVLDNVKPIRANFEQDSESGWQLVTEYGKHPLRQEDIEDLIQAKTDLTIDMDNEFDSSFKLFDWVEAEGRTKNEQLQHLVDDLKWEQKGKEYIPVSVTLFQVRAEDLTINSSMSWENIVSSTENGLMLVDLSVLDVERADFMQGVEEGARGAQPPEKIIFPLPSKLIVQVPFQKEPPESLNASFACQDWKKGQSLAMDIAKTNPSATEADFFSAIGCERVNSMNDAQACFMEPQCDVIVREAYCMVSYKWASWWGNIIRSQNILIHPDDYCRPAQPPPITAPYPTGPATQ